MLQSLFTSHLLKRFFGPDSRRYGKRPVERLIHFLIDQGIITRRTIRHYTVLAEYADMQQSGIYKNKTQIIKVLARRLQLHENTIWNILKDHQTKYHFDFGASQMPEAPS